MSALPGIISVLHTRGQKLNFHPHLHVKLSGGGLPPDGRFVITRHRSFILPVKAVGKVFHGKFPDALKTFYSSGRLAFPESLAALQNAFLWKKFPDTLYETDWVPFLKETFNGNGNAVEYLARYACRTAVSNSLTLVKTAYIRTRRDLVQKKSTKFRVCPDLFRLCFLSSELRTFLIY